MLIIDDNKMKLFKMKKKLLEVSAFDREEALENYKNVVLEIDREAYNDFVKEINDVAYNELSLEEQIDFYNQIDADYTYLNELQCTFKRIYYNYSGLDLQLSDISVIAIDELRERVSAIQGYLLNLKNKDNTILELEKLNADYIKENKMNKTLIDKIKSLEDKTKNDLLIAEGRIQNSSGLQHTSIVDEFKIFDIDLKRILSDNDLLNEIYNDAKIEYRDNEEMLEAASICYQNGNVGDKDVFDRIKLDTLKSKYKLILISIALEVTSKVGDYNLIKNKIDRIIDLIKQRKKVLEELRIKYFIDPFDRININSYLETIKLLDDNVNKMNGIRETMAYFTSVIDDINFENEALYRKINADFSIINTESRKEEKKISYNNYYDDGLESLLLRADNDDKVIDIKDIDRLFLIDRAHEKASGVINRVNQMFNNVSSNVKTPFVEKNPELIIESKVNEVDDVVDTIPKIEDESKDTLFEKTDPFDSSVGIDDNSDQIFVKDNLDNLFEDKKDSGDGLFEETIPFETTPLFDEKYDGGDLSSEIYWGTDSGDDYSKETDSRTRRRVA